MKRLWKAFLHSLHGIKAAWAEEAAFREEIILSFFMIPAAFALAKDNVTLVLMVGSVLIVLVVELLNTAIEAAIDRHGMEWHPLAKKAKDTASAAVLFALLNAGFTWVILLFG